MSRRTRIKAIHSSSRKHSGTNHHTQYSSSTSFFPKCFSVLGEPIKFPRTVLPFHMNGKITYFGDIQSFQYKVKEFKMSQNEQVCQQVHTVNVGIRGQLIKKQSKLNLFVFILSMICCCISSIFSNSTYRSLFFTKYKLSISQYKLLFNLLKNFPNTKILMVTFQDNQLNNEKVQVVNNFFQSSKQQQFTFRNLCYYIDSKSGNINDKLFQKCENLKKKELKFLFIWQKNVIDSTKNTAFSDERQNLLINQQQI